MTTTKQQKKQQEQQRSNRVLLLLASLLSASTTAVSGGGGGGEGCRCRCCCCCCGGGYSSRRQQKRRRPTARQLLRTRTATGLLFLLPLVLLVVRPLYHSFLYLSPPQEAVRDNSQYDAIPPYARLSTADNNHSSHYVPMPHIFPFPKNVSSFFVLDDNDVASMSVETFGSGGGCEAKFLVTFDHAAAADHADDSSSYSTFIFKPSHGHVTAEFGKYEFRPSKGGLVYHVKHHPIKILNELLAYIVDQTLELYRTPPVFPYELSYTQIQQAILTSQNTKNGQRQRRKWFSMFSDCDMDFSVSNGWLRHHVKQQQKQQHWDDSNGTARTTDEETMVVGTLQLKIPNVEKLTSSSSWWSWLVPPSSLTGTTTTTPSAFMEREKNTRLLFDYLIGNWDRGRNNDFVVPSMTSNSGTGQQNKLLLVYIDQNALRGREIPFDLNHNNELLPPSSSCRFYWEPIQKLRSVENFQETILERIMDYPLVKQWINDKVLNERKQFEPLYHMNIRRQVLLNRIDQCITLYGWEHVFFGL